MSCSGTLAEDLIEGHGSHRTPGRAHQPHRKRLGARFLITAGLRLLPLSTATSDFARMGLELINHWNV